MGSAECGVRSKNGHRISPCVPSVTSSKFTLRTPHSALCTPHFALKDWSCHSYCKFSRVGESMWRLLKEFLLFARQEKKWWLIPLVVLLLVLGAILIFASSSGIAWALYPLF